MIDLDEMKRDMETGTPGPWTWDEWFCDLSPLWSCDMCQGTGYISWNGIDARLPNARRIARVPDMEATILAQAATIESLRARVKAADKLAHTIEHGLRWSEIEFALAAYHATDTGEA